jgi:DNA-binding Xre family transcriptional regulator
MIKIKIKEIAKKNELKNAHQLQLAADLTPAAAVRLWKGEVEKISMETLDRLCRTLNCQTGDLFVYIPGEFQPLKSVDESVSTVPADTAA